MKHRIVGLVMTLVLAIGSISFSLTSASAQTMKCWEVYGWVEVWEWYPYPHLVTVWRPVRTVCVPWCWYLNEAGKLVYCGPPPAEVQGSI
ncbi:MAG: hypothetical protein F4Y27_12360 [Acidimicrobiaceae bacterium]|nr:hypothetical protein [Acidimicrobiaceae bacterium]MXW62470.1 hypothetical protein [Acidimicrobiaceae bacterium]MXW77332.1 hypothetical protein [Acidimicrobiaceae bacterium]MYA75456.1 hypothetical protein [Acidimicrobiaceae bacterium]MYC43630.1 hypothetical protein [Acidimicrobiaceae bacterium]